MAKVKMQRHSPTLDMTPMVDLFFLLVTFFMMTTTFAPSEFVQITSPHATSEVKLPETNNGTIVVSADGKVFFRTDGTKNLRKLGEKLNEKYSLGLTESELEKFSRQTGFGMPLSGLKQFLGLTEAQQKNTTMPGIPTEKGKNELLDWIIYTRIVNPDVRMVVKGDRTANYPVIKRVMDSLQDCNVNRFNLITDKETNTLNN
jgi:biopolymer transport protein ExbD